MANKTNCIINGNTYYRIQRKVGKKLNKDGLWIDNIKSFYGKNKKEAEAKFEDYMKRSGKIIDTNKCIGEIIDEWIEVTFKTSSLANSTKNKYLRAYNKIFRHSDLAGQPISTISALDLQKLYNEATECYSTKRAFHNFISNFYSFAVLNKLCEVNATNGLNIPKEYKPDNSGIETWDNEDVKRLIRSLDGNRLKLLVILAVNTGARFAELLALKYEDIQDNCLIINKQTSEIKQLDDSANKGIHITETKTNNSNRSIPLTDYLLSEIDKHHKLQLQEMQDLGYKTDFLFTTKNGTLYYKRNVTRSLKRTCEAHNIPWKKFHALRSTFATNLSRANVPTDTSKTLMGHSSIDTTAEYYISIDASRRKDAIEKIEKYTLTF